jgi:NAD(P)-dependent dehydrogenase (short-subunit alcohol dehydrogenase family)
MRNHSVLITGAAKRLGREIALYFARSGWNVAVHYGASADEAKKTCSEIEALGVKTVAVQGKLEFESDIKRFYLEAEDALGPLDCLINSASRFAYDRASSLEQGMTHESLILNMQINLAAPILLSQMMYQQTIKNKKRHPDKLFLPAIIQLLDQKLMNLNPDYLSYTLSKSALQTAITMMAMDFAPDVRVIGLAPGITLPSGDQTKDEFAKSHQMTPLNKSSTTEDIAAAAFYLANAQAITGTTLYVDGGQHLMSSDRDVMFKIRN